MSVTVEQLLALPGLEKATVEGDGTTVIDSVSLDSSAVTAGGLFAALPGTRTHGAQYAAQTQASAILSDAAGRDILQAAGESRPLLIVDDLRAVLGTIAAEVYGHPTDELTVIGITGTSGKTTTSYLLETGLLHAGYSVGLIGTTGTRINREPVPTKLTTPEAPKLQELFALMRDKGVTHVIMEVSSHALSLGRVQGTRFAAAGFTNLSQDHLDFHPTMEDYFDAKALLFDGPGAAERAVICVDDEWGERMAERARAHRLPTDTVTTKQTGEETSEITARQLSVEPTGAQHVRFDFAAGLRERAGRSGLEFRLPMPGEFNIANAALATGLGSAVGVEVPAFVEGMSEVAVPGRMERIDRGQDFIAVVDYAHKPAAIAAVLDTLRTQLGESGRIGVVVGAGGDRDSAKRPIMGRNAAERADLVVVTDDNPRTEDPATIRAAVLEGAREGANAATRAVDVREEDSRAAAIDAAVAWAGPGDAVIVVGKGHEVGQIIGTETHHFDDREELARALEEKQAGTLGA